MGKADTPAKRAYTAEYNKENMKQVSFKLNKKYDDDIIQYLNTLSNKSELFKKLMRDHIEKEKNKNA